MSTSPSKFTVERLSFNSLTELPNSWQNKDYRALLEKMSYENSEAISEAEVKEMCLMSFTDVEPRAAAEIVLGYLFAEQLSEGQLENLAHQMLTEKLWEENPELALHPGFYKATELLHTAYNGTFPRAQAVQLQVKCTAADPADLALFAATPAAPLLRLLAPGLPDNALLNRLFTAQLAGSEFPEAELILWELTTTATDNNSVVFEVISSAYWLDDFKYADVYEATTHADENLAAHE